MRSHRNLLVTAAAILLVGSGAALAAEPMNLTGSSSSSSSAWGASDSYSRGPMSGESGLHGRSGSANTVGSVYAPQAMPERSYDRRGDRNWAPEADRRTEIFREYEDWNSRIGSNWEQFRPQLRRAFPNISDADLAATGGDRTQVLSLIEERYRLSNDRADQRLTQWQRQAVTASRGL